MATDETLKDDEERYDEAGVGHGRRQVDELLHAPVRMLGAGRSLVTVKPGDTAKTAARAMAADEVAAALVVAEGVLAGIVTERDISKRIVAEGKNPDDVAVADVMTADPITLQIDDPICHAFHRMGTFRDYRHIPLVDGNGKAVGIVSIRDLVDFTVDCFPEHLANVPPDPHPIDPTQFGG